MKKILLILIILSLYSCSLLNSNVTSNILTDTKSLETTKLDNKIFKILTYKYNSEFNIFSYYAYGSAVLIDENTLLTNAHVLLDEDNNVLGNYVGCYNYNSTYLPQCKYSLKIKSIDKDNDLAILTIDKLDFDGKSVSFDGGVTFGNGNLSLNDDMDTYGYPSIGGDTITVSKGKVSGFSSNGDIKTDAKIDEGSSGGGVFNGGKLVGISTYIISNNNTLGYVIPIIKINKFLYSQNTYKAQTFKYNGFKEYYKKITDFYDGNGIFKNSGLSFNGFSNNFNIDYLDYTKFVTYLELSGINGYKDVNGAIYSTYISNNLNLKPLDIINGVNDYFYHGQSKSCDGVFNPLVDQYYKCKINYQGKDDDYNIFVGYHYTSNHLYIYEFNSKINSGKDFNVLQNSFNDFVAKISYYDDGINNTGLIGDFNFDTFNKYTKVIFPSTSESIVYSIALLTQNNENFYGNIDIKNNKSIHKIVQNGTFDNQSYIKYLNDNISEYSSGKVYSLKTDYNGNQYFYGEYKNLFDYVFLSYNGYIYNASFYVKNFDLKLKTYIKSSMTSFNLTNKLKSAYDLDNFTFNQKIKQDLDGKWYLYESSLNGGKFDDYGNQYNIISKYPYINVYSGSILLNNNKINNHINLAQSIKYNDGLLDKYFNITSKSNFSDETSYTIKLIVGKYIEGQDTQYTNRENNLIFMNKGITGTVKIKDLIKDWRKMYNYDDSIKPDIIRISIGVNNSDGKPKQLQIVNLELK